MIGIDEALYKACEDNRKLEVEIEEKDKEIENLKQEIDKLVDTIEDVNREFSQYKYENKKEIERLNNIINELEKLLEEELDKLARETSNIYEDSLGNTKLVNEDIFKEVSKIENKLQELKEATSNE